MSRVSRSTFVWALAAEAAFAIAIVLPGLAQASANWPVSSPESVGISQKALHSLLAGLQDDPNRDLKGVVVVRHNRLAVEWYFNGDDQTTLHDIRSATKSITATLMGIAIDHHLIGGVNDPIGKYLPGLPNDGKQTIRIRDLLTMRSGLAADDDDPDSPGNEDRLDQSTDWMRSMFAVPVKTPPGQNYLYCSLNAFITGAIVENVSGIPLDQFARKYLFSALGIDDFKWRHVPINRVVGQGNLYITARDEAAIGQLFLQNGRWRNQRLVSAKWVRDSFSEMVPISAVDPYADFYGYMWYTRAEPVEGHSVLVHFASGNGGNKIYVVPSKDMVVAITSSAYHKGYGQRRSQDILLRILAAASNSN
jgi:CubicO group peptidase (beta-lactamase class C family)